MTKDEALKLALEAMEYADACLKKQLTMKYKHEYAQDLLLEAGTAIKEALAQRTWVGLTLDERIELAQDVDWAIGAYCEYAEKIEAKLKEKNVL
jgi:hypothetical protein